MSNTPQDPFSAVSLPTHFSLLTALCVGVSEIRERNQFNISKFTQILCCNRLYLQTFLQQLLHRGFPIKVVAREMTY